MRGEVNTGQRLSFTGIGQTTEGYRSRGQNRTRENRPSGIEEGACGNVSGGIRLGPRGKPWRVTGLEAARAAFLPDRRNLNKEVFMVGRMHVWDPDFVANSLNYLGLVLNEQEFRSKVQAIRNRAPTQEERLRTLVDRIEFISHLGIVRDYARGKGFILAGQEVRGIQFDIDSLRIYLALTCVDIFSRFVPFDEWLMSHCNAAQEGESFSELIQRKRDEYKKEFGTTSSFVRAFSECPEQTLRRLENNLTVLTNSGEESSNIVEIARYLSKVRNKYTHEGRRFHLSSSVPFDQVQLLGPRDETRLFIQQGFDLVDAILEVATARARKVLELQ
jgi:hypothetical protein